MNWILTPVLLVFALSFLQAQEVIYQDSFDDLETSLFREVDNTDNQGQIKSSQYTWKYSGQAPHAITLYCNRLDASQDFSVEINVKSFMSGSASGLIWGGSSPMDAQYFLVKGKRYSICRISDGQVQCAVDHQTGKVRLDKNLLKVQKLGSTVNYFINDHLVYSEPFTGINGKVFGLAMWSAGSVLADDFVLKGTELPINIVAGLRYEQLPEHLGASINTEYEEMTPVITPNRQGIYFSRRFDPGNTGGTRDLQDVYFSRFTESGWSEAKNVGRPINNDGPNAVFSVSPDGNTLLLMNTYTPDGQQKGMGLSISHRTKEGWTVPRDVKMRSFYNKSFYNEYFLGNDGKVILLAVNRDDGYGSRDLYVSFYEGNEIWSAPKNLGNTINTAGTELSPFLAADGKTLYFSSNGHPGLGRNDIFMSKRMDESWTNWTIPSNLGRPINSTGTDAYYSVPAAGDYAYYVSNDQGAGRNDIFRIALPTPVKPEPVVLVYGKVLNSKTRAPIATGITYQQFTNNHQVGIAQSDPSNGHYEIVLPVNQIYSFFAEKSGFYSVQDRLDLSNVTEYQEVERDLYLTPIESGQLVTMNNVLFYQSKAQLIPTSYPELDNLAGMMLENLNVRIQLEGHTDNVGDRFKNQKLSEERVEEVKQYLVNQGVEADRITGVGYGGSKPIADNSRELTRRLNRRVEFRISEY